MTAMPKEEFLFLLFFLFLRVTFFRLVFDSRAHRNGKNTTSFFLSEMPFLKERKRDVSCPRSAPKTNATENAAASETLTRHGADQGEGGDDKEDRDAHGCWFYEGKGERKGERNRGRA